MEDLSNTIQSFMIAFTQGYLLQMSRFWDLNEGKFIRHRLAQNVKPSLLKSNLTMIPNLTIDHYRNRPYFREFVTSNINELSDELFSFLKDSLTEDQKLYMIYSEEEGAYKDITPNRDDVLVKIAHYFGVVILIYEPGMTDAKIFREDTSPKISVCVEYSNQNFRPFNYPGGDLVNAETLLNPPYYISNKPTRTGGIPEPVQNNKNLETFLQMIVEAIDFNKNFLTEDERNKAIDVLEFDKNFAGVRNKLITVKVCGHTGRFGVFECKHYHCYSCLSDEILDAGGNTSGLKCPCDKDYSLNDIMIAQNRTI
jgi:hypothetical protein